MDNRDVEKVISLRELFWQIVMAWRFWIISGIIFAVLISGMHYVKGMKNVGKCTKLEQILLKIYSLFLRSML